MNPYVALQIAEDHQARLRGGAGVRAPHRSLGDVSRALVGATERARRATGWALVEIGFKLAASVSRESVPGR
jgi:hypothetical protein